MDEDDNQRAHARIGSKGVMKQDRNKKMNFMLGVLLGPFQTILDENIERIATIEHRRYGFYYIEIKG